MTNKNNPDNLTVIGHLDELRKRIVYALICLLAGVLAGLYFAKDFLHLLEMPAAGALSGFILVKPTDIISIYFKISLYLGALLAAPAVLYNAWQYVKPAVPKDANLSLAGWSAAAAALFFAGTAFSYKILLPLSYAFLIELSKEVATPMITLNSYISFALAIIAAGGLVFEMPVVSGLLTRIGVVTPTLLRAKRKEAIFALCIIAAVITPTADVFNMMLFVLPMILLYEVSVLVSSVVHKIYFKDPAGEIYAN